MNRWSWGFSAVWMVGMLLAAIPALAADADKPDMEAIRDMIAHDRHAEAARMLEAWMAAHPADDEARFLLALEDARLGRRDEAIERFRLISVHHPEWPEPHANLASLYAWAGELEAAAREERLYLDRVPDSTMARRNLGWLHARLALRYYRKVLERHDDPVLRRRVVALQAMLAEHGKAPEDSTEATMPPASSPTDKP